MPHKHHILLQGVRCQTLHSLREGETSLQRVEGRRCRDSDA